MKLRNRITPNAALLLNTILLQVKGLCYELPPMRHQISGQQSRSMQSWWPGSTRNIPVYRDAVRVGRLASSGTGRRDVALCLFGDWPIYRGSGCGSAL